MSDYIRLLLPDTPVGGGVSAILSRNRQIAASWGLDLGAAAFAGLSQAMEGLPLSHRKSRGDFDFVVWEEPQFENAKKVPNYSRKGREDTIKNSLRATTAAAGIPAPVMKFLRAENLFGGSNIYRKNAVCLGDAAKFHADLLAVSEPFPKGRSSTLTPLLHAIRHRKFNGAEGKGRFLKAVLLKEIKLFRKGSSAAEDLSVRSDDIDEFVARMRLERFDGGLSAAEAADALQTSDSTVYGLINDGVLSTVGYSAWTRVTPASLAKFKKDYVSVTEVSRRYGLKGRQTVLSYLRDSNIEPVRWRGLKEGTMGSYFIRASDLTKAVGIIEERLHHRSRALTIKRHFRDPQNPMNVWEGLGRRPQWLRDYVSAGHAMDDFLVES
jgi:hypothetical protein